MSCCDNVTVEIVNNSPTLFTVQSVSSPVGGTHDLREGQTIAAGGGTLSGTAFSKNGTDGAVSGSIVVTTGTYTLTLPFAFTPKNKLGKCPCTASSQSTVTDSNYTAECVATSGSSEGSASTVWTLSSQAL